MLKARATTLALGIGLVFLTSIGTISPARADRAVGFRHHPFFFHSPFFFHDRFFFGFPGFGFPVPYPTYPAVTYYPPGYYAPPPYYASIGVSAVRVCTATELCPSALAACRRRAATRRGTG